MKKKEKLAGVFAILSLVPCFAAFVLKAGELFEESVAMADRVSGLNSGLYFLFFGIGLVLFAVYMLKAEKKFSNLILPVCAFALFAAVDFGYAYMSFTAPALFEIRAVNWAICGLLLIFSVGSLVSVMTGLKAGWFVLVYGILNILLPLLAFADYVLNVLDEEGTFAVPDPLFCIEVLGGLFFGISMIVLSSDSAFPALFGRKGAALKKVSVNRKCPKCGAVLEGDSLFCGECGTNVGSFVAASDIAEETGASKSGIILTRVFAIVLLLVLFAAAAGCLYFAGNAVSPDTSSDEPVAEEDFAAELIGLLNEVRPTDDFGGFLCGPVFAVEEGGYLSIPFYYDYDEALYAFAPEGITFEWTDSGCFIEAEKAGIYTLGISRDRNSERKGVQAVIIVYSDEIPASKPVETKEDDDAYTTFIDTLMYVIDNGLYPFWM